MPQRFHLSHIVNNFYTQGDVCFHPFGSCIYSPIANNLLKIDFEKNQTKLFSCETQSSIEKIQFCKEGNLMLIADQDNRVYLFNSGTEKALGSKKFKHKITHLGFSHNNKFFYVVSGRYVFFYERPDNLNNVLLEPFFLLKKYNSKASKQIMSLRLTSDDSNMIYASDDYIIRFQPIFINDNYNEKFELVGHKGPVTDFIDTLLLNGHLVTIDTNGLLLLWKLVDKDESDFQKNTNFSRSGKKIEENKKNQQPVELSNNDKLSFLEKKLKASKFILSKKQLVYQENTSINSYKFENNMLLVSFYNKTFCLYSLNYECDEFLKTIMTFKLSENLANSLVFHPNKTLLSCAVAEKGQLIVWDWKSKHYLLQQSSFGIQVSAYAFNPNADILAIADFKGDVRLFDTKTFFNTVTFTDSNAKITGLKFINQKTLLSSSLDGIVRAYDLIKYKLFRELKPETPNQLFCLDCENNGEIIFAGGFDPYCVYMWSYKTGLLLDVLSGHSGPVDLLKYSNKLQTLITCSWDKTIRIIKPFSRMLNSEELKINDKIMALSISKNELDFCIGTYRNEIHLYNIESGQLSGLIDCSQQFNNSFITSVELSFDNSKVFATGNKNKVYIYDTKHRSIQNQFTITQNKDYKNTIERMNNANIVDGFNTDELNQIKYKNIDQTILPGSKIESYSKNINQKINEFGSLEFSDDGKFLALISSDGLCLFTTNHEKSSFNIDETIDKKYLIGLLNTKRYVEYTCACLKIENKDIFKPIIDKLDRKSIHSIVTLLNEQEIDLLLQWLVYFWKDIKDVEIMLIWFESVFLLGYVKQINADRLPQIKTIINELKYRIDEFVDLSASNRATLDYLIDQVNN